MYLCKCKILNAIISLICVSILPDFENSGMYIQHINFQVLIIVQWTEALIFLRNHDTASCL